MVLICSIHDISDPGSKGVLLGDLSLFVVHKDAQFYVYKNHCPHLGIELHWQEDQFLDMDNALIQCATHGALFLIETGECVAGPCSGQSLQPIDFQIIDGNIVIAPN